MSSDGLFHPNLAADYILDHGRHKWLTTSELSKVFTGANTIDGKRRVRRQMFAVFTILLARGEFLVYETSASNGRVTSVKVLDVRSDAERQMARPQLERMLRRRQVTTAKYELALKVIDLQYNIAFVRDDQ